MIALILWIDIICTGVQLTVVLNHTDGTKDSIAVNHTYNEPQIEWFKEGGALNVIRKEFAGK